MLGAPPRLRRFFGCAIPAIGLLALAGCGGGGSSKLSEQDIIKNSTPGVVELLGTQGQNHVGGSGIVVDAQKGLVLTNAHVVSGVTSLKAVVLGQTGIPAQIVAQAPCDDLAVVRLVNPPSGLKALPIGTSGTEKAGTSVTVLGYPETLSSGTSSSGAAQNGPTSGADNLLATTGTISNPNSAASIDPSSIKYPSVIIHSAAVNHGDSGGPLVDEQGKVIGINTLTAAGAGSGQIQGQYYAISIDHAKGLLSRLESGESIANLGWNLVPIDKQLINQVFGESLGAQVVTFLQQQNDTQGLVVIGVDPGSAVAKANISVGDYISKINDTNVTSVQDVCDVAQSAPSGSTLSVKGRYLTDAAQFNKSIGDSFTQDVKVP